MANIKNLKDLLTRFSDEQVCRDYLVQHRWGGVPICPYCGCNKSYKIENGKRYKCANKECHKKYSVTVGTVAQDTNISLSIWFGATYILSSHKKGISSVQLGKDLGVSQKTAWFILHRIREAFREKKGLFLTKEVQADETYIGGKESNKHEVKKLDIPLSSRMEDKTPVVGLVQTGGNVVTKAMPWVTKKNINNLITEHVSKDATLVTDSSALYHSLNDKYNHIVINHSHHQYRVGTFHTNSIENYWSIFKRGIYGIYHQISRKHLQAYCSEFEFRFNNRKANDADRFEMVLSTFEGNMSYKKLTGK